MGKKNINCFWGHKWSEWKHFDYGFKYSINQIQERRCLKCNKEQREFIKYKG